MKQNGTRLITIDGVNYLANDVMLVQSLAATREVSLVGNEKFETSVTLAALLLLLPELEEVTGANGITYYMNPNALSGVSVNNSNIVLSFPGRKLEVTDTAAALNLRTEAKVVEVDESYTAFVTDDVIVGTAVATITLPAVASCYKDLTIICDVDAGANLTVDGNASEEINGAATQTVTPGDSLVISPYGDRWLIKSFYIAA